VIAPFLALGVVTSALLLETMLSGHPSAKLGSYHVAYSIGLQHGVVIIGLYILATCGSMLASGLRNVVWFGAVNLVAVIVLARLCANGSHHCGVSTQRWRAARSRCTCASPRLARYQSRSSQRGVALPVEFVRRAIPGAGSNT